MDEESVGLIMYKQYLKVEQTRLGNSLFTTVEIPANVPIVEVMGPIYLEKDLPDPGDEAILQVGPNTFLGASGEVDYCINHSCDPNCAMHVVGNRAILYSLYVIPAGIELTFDYSTTSTDTYDTWKMDCKCNSYKCRKVISGFQYLDPALQDNYKKRDMVPIYIVHPSMIQKRVK